MKRRTAICLVSVLLSPLASQALAQEEIAGRRPVSESTTLTRSGGYVLTRSLDAQPDRATLTIDAAAVNIDLAGFALHGASTIPIVECTANSEHLVLSGGSLIHPETGCALDAAVLRGCTDVELRDMTVRGGRSVAATGAVTAHGSRFSSLCNGVGGGDGSSIVRSAFTNCDDTCVQVGDRSMVIENEIVYSTYRAIRAGSGSIVARNRIGTCTEGCIQVGGNSLVVRNSIDRSEPGPAFVLRGGGTTLAENAVVGMGLVDAFGGGHTIRDNTFTAEGFQCFTGMHLRGDGYRVVDNTAVGCSRGAVVEGDRSLLQGNRLQGTLACSLEFGSDASTNVYRDNDLSGSFVPFCGGSAGDNIDGGGNRF